MTQISEQNKKYERMHSTNYKLNYKNMQVIEESKRNVGHR